MAIAPRVPVKAEFEVFPLKRANDAIDRLHRGQLRGAAVLQVDSWGFSAFFTGVTNVGV